MWHSVQAERDLHLPWLQLQPVLSGRWKYAWLHLVLWGSCGEKGQVELMDYSRTQRGCRLSNAAGCLSRTRHFYDNLSRPQRARRRPREPSPPRPDCAGFTVNKIHFQGNSNDFRACLVDMNYEGCSFEHCREKNKNKNNSALDLNIHSFCSKSRRLCSKLLYFKMRSHVNLTVLWKRGLAVSVCAYATGAGVRRSDLHPCIYLRAHV